MSIVTDLRLVKCQVRRLGAGSEQICRDMPVQRWMMYNMVSQ